MLDCGGVGDTGANVVMLCVVFGILFWHSIVSAHWCLCFVCAGG